MHRSFPIKKSIFPGLLLVLIFFSISFAAERKTAIGANSECSMVLLKNQEYFSTLMNEIDKAESEIVMSFFLFKAGEHKNSCPDKIVAHLALAVQRGVKVLVILENSGGHDSNLDAGNKLTKKLLEDKGVQVYFDSPEKITHTKLVVIDRRIVLLGSHNLTQSALKYNNEVSLMINNPELAGEARTYMLKIMKE